MSAECSACGVEGVAIEVYDPDEPACALGVPAEVRCRLCECVWRGAIAEGLRSQGLARRGTGHCPACGHALTEGETAAHACIACGTRASLQRTAEGANLKDRAAFDTALARIARDEGTGDVEVFVRENFQGRTVDGLFEAIAAGARIETSFGVLDTLFQRGGAMRGGAVPSRRATPHRPITVPPPARPAEHAYDPRAMVLALVSVLAADGQYDAREMAFIERFVLAEGMAPLKPEEMRVHRPVEVQTRIPPARRAEVVALMIELACIDGSVDPSEMRIVESYATAWGIADDEVAAMIEKYSARYATDLQRFLRRVRAFFLAPRDPHAPRKTP